VQKKPAASELHHLMVLVAAGDRFGAPSRHPPAQSPPQSLTGAPQLDRHRRRWLVAVALSPPATH
jgi:hypothetical protein